MNRGSLNDGAFRPTIVVGYYARRRRPAIERGIMPGMAAVGEYLRQCRVARGWTQDDAAEESGFSSRIVSDWENAVKVPGADSLFQYLDVLGGSIEEAQRAFLGRPAHAFSVMDDFEARVQAELDAGDREAFDGAMRVLRSLWRRRPGAGKNG